jgi:FtsZ-binding cell division protein ZapB
MESHAKGATLSLDILNELENKVQSLITALENVRNENLQFKQEIENRDNKISEIESENENLKTEVEILKLDSQGHQEKLTQTTEKIQGILARLETVQSST